MDELELAKLLGIACQATCGCGNGLIKYEGEASNTNFFLTCRPYSDKYAHPMKIVIPKDCQLIKDHYENKQLKEEKDNAVTLLKERNEEKRTLLQKLENIDLIVMGEDDEVSKLIQKELKENDHGT